MKFLSGWKTYLLALIGIIFNGLVATGYIDEGMREPVNAILLFLGLGTMRSAIKKVEPK